MQVSDYQKFVPTTFIHGPTDETDINHVTHGLFAEAGEVAGAYQKFYRGDYDEDELLNRVAKELGGLMYYAAMLCNLEGLELEDILELNADILIDRQKRNALMGDGDNR